MPVIVLPHLVHGVRDSNVLGHDLNWRAAVIRHLKNTDLNKKTVNNFSLMATVASR